MPRSLKFLQIGTRVRVKGNMNNTDGRIINWLTDDKKVLTGYLVQSDEDSTLIPLTFDDEFEVLKT